MDIEPSEIASDSDADQRSESALSGNFEDIDSLLANAQQGQDNQKPISKQTSSKAKRRTKSKPQPTQGAVSQPRPKGPTNKTSGKTLSADQSKPNEPALIPNSQWDSEAARKKKRILQIVMLALLAIVGIGIGVWALISGGSTDKPIETIAKNDPTAIPSATNTDADPVSPDSTNPPNQGTPPIAVDTGDAGDGTNAMATDTTTPNSTPPSELSPQAVVDNTARQSSPPPLEVNTPPEITYSDNIGPTDPKDSNDPTGNAAPPLANANAPDKSPTAADGSPLIPSTENSLGKLSEILQGQGTSLKEIEDIAEIQKERALIGTPAYLIERPNRKELNIERQLAAELSGWKLDGVPLIDAIKDLEMLSDVPVTFDPDLFHDGSFNITRPITMKVEAVTFKAALESLVAEDGLSIQSTTTGVLVTAPQVSEVITKSYPQTFCTSENSIGRLRDLIIAVTGINDWDEVEEHKLEVFADSVSVSHRQNEQQQIADLLEKLNAAANYKNNPAAMKGTLLPLALAAEGTLASSPELKTSNPYQHSMRLGSLFRQVRQVTNLTTIIDWENLAKQGWYPNTIVPGKIAEPTNRQLLEQLGHSMEATTIVIGSDTVMLTTFENAGQQRNIEVYSVGDVIDNKMTAPQLDQLLTETLGIDQLTPPNATVIYFAECKCLVAKAPQIIQRQLHSIVNKL